MHHPAGQVVWGKRGLYGEKMAHCGLDGITNETRDLHKIHPYKEKWGKCGGK